VIQDQKSGSGVIGKGLAQLLPDPLTCGVAGNTVVKNAASIMTDDEEDVEHSEGDRRYREKVHGCNRFAVIAQEGEPALARIRQTRSTPHPAGDAALRNLKAQHEQFAVDARGTPDRILGHHFEDELANVLGHRFPARRLPRAGDELPIQLKAGACQRTTVSGDTSTSIVLQRGQTRRSNTQNSLSVATSLGRDRRRFNTTSC
jgi:hypothetical protein